MSVTAKRTRAKTNQSAAVATTPIARCVNQELDRHFAVLDGQPPCELYDNVMQQAEAALIRNVMQRCEGNKTRAATWLGISRGTLSNRLAALGLL